MALKPAKDSGKTGYGPAASAQSRTGDQRRK